MTRNSTSIARGVDTKAPNGCVVIQATPDQPGAIAILQLVGGVEGALRELTGVDDWPIGRARLVRFADIDEGIAARVSEDIAQLMPHGGLRVVQRLLDRLIVMGVQPASATDIDPAAMYPEAADRFEAMALAAIARAASPLAVDLLLDQPRRWRMKPRIGEEDRARSRRLNRLIQPPIVVVAGAANVGKSTLSNALLGRSMSIAADQPGTTRDYTTARIDLAGLVVEWHDTPGLRDTSDPIERKAVEIARRLMERADFLIAMADREEASRWPALPREPDLHVINKIDRPTRKPRLTSEARKTGVEPLRISALTGAGLPQLVASVRDRLVPPTDLAHPGPWLFDERLK